MKLICIICLYYSNPFYTQTVLQTDNPFHSGNSHRRQLFRSDREANNNISGQTVVFSRDNLASGLYFVRLTEKIKSTQEN